MYKELHLNLHLFIFPVYTPLQNLLAKKKKIWSKDEEEKN